MAFQTSPGINVSEVDLTNSTPAVGTTEGAIAGVFRWGPENERVLISSEQQLVERFGAPATYYTNLPTDLTTWKNHETFFTAANFLSYSDALYVSRVTDSTAAFATEGTENFSAKYKGKLGNSIGVSHCVTDSYAQSVGDGAVTLNPSSNGGTISALTTAQAQTIVVGDVISPTHSTAVKEDLKITKVETLSGDGSTTSFAVDIENLDASAAGGIVAEGIVLNEEDAVSVLASNIVSLSATAADADAIATGDAITYDTNGATAIGATFIDGTTGLLQNGRVYYAIRVNDGSTTKADQGKLLVAGSTRTIKLAATYVDAITHTDGAPKNIAFTSRSGDTSAVQNFVRSENITLGVTFSSRYTGITQLTNGTGGYTKQWGEHLLFDAAPVANSAHIIVKDVDGEITGTAGSILERFENVSMIPGSKYFDGASSFVTDVLNDNSNWIKLAADNATLTGSTSQKALTNGSDGLDEEGITLGDVVKGYDLYKDGSDVDISFILQGKAKGTNGLGLANYLIDNIADTRRDCILFASPQLSDDTATEVVAFGNGISSSSYAVIDSGYKYQYDKYADTYRWIPLNGDIAGLCARTDDLRDPWFSPAGYQRGTIKNSVKLKFNPTKTERDLLYKNGVNPVITQPGQGTLLFGDKTKAATTSAFDRINVRRLFIVLEKTIGTSAKSTLFEFNDEFTRASFVNLVEPFLRDVQGRRGIYDFKVICDQSNNTPQVIDANQFVGDIYIKPARSINFIQLNFVAVRSGVEFKEIVGAA